MRKILFILLSFATLFTSASAFADVPCIGANDSCAWFCNTDAGGNVLNYTVVCDDGLGVGCLTPGEGTTSGPCPENVSDVSATTPGEFEDAVLAEEEPLGRTTQ